MLSRGATSTWWPRARSASTTPAGMCASTCTSGPGSTRKRGASLIACGFWPNTARRAIICTWPCACIEPPITPSAITGSPPRVTKPGMMVCSGFLFGADAIGVARRQREALAAVVQADAGARHHHAGAEAAVVRLDHDTMVPSASALAR